MKIFCAQLRNGVVALAMIILGTVVLAGTPVAQATSEPGTCNAAGFTKGDNEDQESGSGTYVWGTMSWDDGKIHYTVTDGFRVEFCIKQANAPVYTSGWQTGSGTFDSGQDDMSHVGYRFETRIPVTPSVTMVDECGTANDTGPTYEANTEHWTAVAGAENTVVFTAKDGWYFPAGDKVSDDGYTWTESYTPNTDEACEKTPVAVPANQEPTAPGCDVDGSYALPEDTEQVDWSIAPDYDGPGTYTVTAALKNPATHEWSDGTSADKTWTVEVLGATGECEKTPVAVPANQEPTAPGCDVDGSYALPEDTEQVDWSIAPAYDGPGTYTVTAALKNPATHEWSDGTSADKTWTVEVLGATGDCAPPPEPLAVQESTSGCDLSGFGDFEAGVIHRDGLQEYVWDAEAEEWVLESADDIEWGPWTQSTDDVWDDEEYFAECASGQPAAEIRQTSGSEDSCPLGGTLVWTETSTTEYVWDAELRAWVLGEEGEPVREEELTEWSQEKFERLCEVAGVQGQVQVMDYELETEVEVKGVQETAVPTAVNAGLGTTPFTPVGVRRNPLALVALGGGLLLLGAAGRRKRATAVR